MQKYMNISVITKNWNQKPVGKAYATTPVEINDFGQRRGSCNMS